MLASPNTSPLAIATRPRPRLRLGTRGRTPFASPDGPSRPSAGGGRSPRSPLRLAPARRRRLTAASPDADFAPLRRQVGGGRRKAAYARSTSLRTVRLAVARLLSSAFGLGAGRPLPPGPAATL